MNIVITAFDAEARSVTYTVNGGSPITKTGLGNFSTKAELAGWLEAISSVGQDFLPLPDMSEFVGGSLPPSKTLAEQEQNGE